MGLPGDMWCAGMSLHLSPVIAVTYEVTSKSSTCHHVSLRNHGGCDVCDVCDACRVRFYVLAVVSSHGTAPLRRRS
jgi:hypothetical protein